MTDPWAQAYVADVRALLAAGELGTRGAISGAVTAALTGIEPVAHDAAHRRFRALVADGVIADDAALLEKITSGFFGRVVTLFAAVADRAQRKGLLPAGLMEHTAAQQRAVIDVLAENYVAVHTELGWSLTHALTETPALHLSIADVRALYRANTDLPRSTVTHHIINCRSNPARALQRYRDTVTELSEAHPERDPYIVRHFALANPRNPEAAIDRYEATCAALAEQHPDLDAHVVRGAARNNPGNPEAALRRFLASRSALAAAYPNASASRVTRFALSHPGDPLRAFEQYLDACTALSTAYPRVPDFVIDAIALKRTRDVRSAMVQFMTTRRHLANNNPDLAANTIYRIVLTHRDADAAVARLRVSVTRLTERFPGVDPKRLEHYASHYADAEAAAAAITQTLRPAPSTSATEAELTALMEDAQRAGISAGHTAGPIAKSEL